MGHMGASRDASNPIRELESKTSSDIFCIPLILVRTQSERSVDQPEDLCCTV